MTNTWLNQKIANFFRDFKEEQEPEEDPSPARGVCRIVLLIILIVGFSVSLAYLSWNAPDVRVQQIFLQGKELNYSIDHLYNRLNESNPNEPRVPSACPCTTATRDSWRNYLSFHILTHNSTDWNLSFDASNISRPTITMLAKNGTPANSASLLGDIQKDSQPLTAEKFCNISSMWPMDNKTYDNSLCEAIATLLLPLATDNPNDYSSGAPLELPMLLNREVFSNIIAKNGQDSIFQLGKLALDFFHADEANKRYINALIFYLGNSLFLELDTLSEWEAYDSGASDMVQALTAYEFFNDPEPSVFVLNDTEGRIVFLQPEIDWMKYYRICKPTYCEVTTQMNLLNKVFRAAGLLGGVMTIILAIVNIVLWPAVVFLLRWYFKNSEKDEQSRILPAGVRSHDLEILPEKCIAMSCAELALGLTCDRGTVRLDVGV